MFASTNATAGTYFKYFYFYQSLYYFTYLVYMNNNCTTVLHILIDHSLCKCYSPS